MSELSNLLAKSVSSGVVSVSQIATAAGCTPQHVRNILRGRNDCTINLAAKMAKTCGFSLVFQKNKKNLSKQNKV